MSQRCEKHLATDINLHSLHQGECGDLKIICKRNIQVRLMSHRKLQGVLMSIRPNRCNIDKKSVVYKIPWLNCNKPTLVKKPDYSNSEHKRYVRLGHSDRLAVAQHYTSHEINSVDVRSWNAKMVSTYSKYQKISMGSVSGQPSVILLWLTDYEIFLPLLQN